MTKQEQQIKAKLPGELTGIEIRNSVCDICTPGPQCGLHVYVKDGKAVKIEGMPQFPGSGGKLCTRGAANRQYVYRENRIRTPLKRTGKRGENSFAPISWEEAYDLIEKNLSAIRETYGPDSVVWFTGYTKWIRPWLRRMCMSFGSHNYMTESSTCFRAGRMANETIFGRNVRADLMGKPRLIVGWAANPYISSFPMGKGYAAAKKAGAKIIIIDVRHTQAAEKAADLFLQPRIGTDTVLAHGIAREIIRNGWEDREFIRRYVHGYDAYKEMVSRYDLATVERITGVPREKIQTAAEWIGHIKPAAISPNNGIVHHSNGFNAHRAIMCLNLITGNVDKSGTVLPVYDTFCDMGSGFDTFEEDFMSETMAPKTLPQIGENRFPLWNKMTGDAQAMDLPRQILEGTPYEIHALAAFGVNDMIFPEPAKFRQALEKLDFIFATELVWTRMCSYADVVLPICSSLERSELKCYPGGFFYYTSPAIEPLYESKDDVEVIAELARRLCPQDPLLGKGYHEGIRYMFREMTEEVEAAKASCMPCRSARFQPYIPGTYLAEGAQTPSGKLELYSELIAGMDPSCGLDPLPVYYEGDQGSEQGRYPFVLMTGARLPHAIHSRCHNVPCLRSLRPEPMVDINPEDAGRLGILQGDKVRLFNETGQLVVLANVTVVANVGELHLIHGYEEACATDLISWNKLDPYSGFPAYKQVRCNLRKEEPGEL